MYYETNEQVLSCTKNDFLKVEDMSKRLVENEKSITDMRDKMKALKLEKKQLKDDNKRSSY